jgi:hypothetical protein
MKPSHVGALIGTLEKFRQEDQKTLWVRGVHEEI